MPSEIRKDYLLDRYVIIAPRDRRETPDVVRPEHLNHTAQACPFCPSQADQFLPLLTIGPKAKWHIKTISSREPAFHAEHAHPALYGRHEIVIETPNHIQPLESLPEEHVHRVLQTYAHRLRDIIADKKIQFISIRKNSGGRAQPVREHAHSQITATAFIPPEMAIRLTRAKAFQQEHGICAYCDIIRRETAGARAIYENEFIIAFAPYASFKNYEVWIMPKRHVSDIAGLSDNELASMAKLLKLLSRAISDLQLPYTYDIDQVAAPLADGHHLFVHLAPRGTVWSGPETAGGLIVNAVSPEEAAAYYREALKN